MISGIQKGSDQLQHSENMIQIILAAIGGALGWFFGGFDGFWYTLVVLVIIDYLSGVMCAVIEKKLSSEIGFRGICKKVAIFLLVGVGNVLDQRILGSGNALRTTVIFFYCANEGISLLENAVKIGIPVPQKLKDTLLQVKNSSSH